MAREKDKKVQIKVTVETREWLKRCGNKGQTYDDIIVKALRAAEAEGVF